VQRAARGRAPAEPGRGGCGGQSSDRLVDFRFDPVKGGVKATTTVDDLWPAWRASPASCFAEGTRATTKSVPKGALYYWKSSFLRELSDEAIDTLVAQFAACPSPMTAMVIEQFHGEVSRIPADATAAPIGDEAYNVVIPCVWTDPAAAEENIAWARGRTPTA